MITFRTGGSSYAMRYSVSNDTWSPSRINPLHGAMHGITPVTDPTTGLVYLAAGYTGIRSEMSIYDFEKDTIYSGQPLPDPSQIFEARAYYRAVWSKKRESILYFGGYNTMLKTVDHANTVSEFVPKTLTWQVMPTTGEIPTMRADHCMASNDDGTLVIVYGGRVNASPTTFSGELFILDTDKRTWKKGLTGPSRIYSACTVAGDQFIIWGGLNGDYQSAEKPMLIYNLTKDEWVDAYTPPTAYTDKSTKSDTAAGSSSITGAIIGGTVGCLAIIIIFALAWVFLRRRQNTIRGSLINSQDDDEYGNTNRNSHYASTSFEADRSPGLRGLAHQDRDHEQEALELRQGLLLQNHPPVGSYRPQTTYVPSRRSGEARRSVMNDAPPSAPGFAYGSPYNSGMTPSAKN
ncbi:hypothetical protein BGW38_010718 [Lunasporangiospora selenospora]|uniref:Kelch motif-containing protein n=1 Tax=Lunasporangiospora selenospora TaxID=979761 RepID=A0A9P6KEQ5_9FUNG|nr:hypothetical protein BGW38_010718 [Lunasporangiospora selenospora]